MFVGPTFSRLARFLNAVGLARVNHAAKAVIRRATGDSITVKVDGLAIEGPMASRRVLSQIKAGTLEPFEAALFVNAIRPGMTVLDIGANIGYYTLLAARKVGPAGNVFAFEADPRTASSLQRNL